MNRIIRLIVAAAMMAALAGCQATGKACAKKEGCSAAAKCPAEGGSCPKAAGSGASCQKSCEKK